jgi:hypothetical protein
VIRTENHAVLRNFDRRIHRAGDSARIDITRMRSYAPDRPCHRPRVRRNIFAEVAQQLVSPRRIKPASHRRSSQTGSHNCVARTLLCAKSRQARIQPARTTTRRRHSQAPETAPPSVRAAVSPPVSPVSPRSLPAPPATCPRRSAS